MATKLAVYNAALLHLGQRATTLAESSQTRRDLDRAWDADFIDACLGRGQWKFAMRSSQLDYDSGLSAGFGSTLTYGFEIPSDHIRLAGFYSDADMLSPMRDGDYREEAGYWWSLQETVYVRFVSNDAAYGGDLTKWPAPFADFAAAELAFRVAISVTGDADKRNDMWKLKEKSLLPLALSRDAMQEPARMPTASNWVRARRGGMNGDRGSRGSLIG